MTSAVQSWGQTRNGRTSSRLVVGGAHPQRRHLGFQTSTRCRPHQLCAVQARCFAAPPVRGLDYPCCRLRFRRRCHAPLCPSSRVARGDLAAMRSPHRGCWRHLRPRRRRRAAAACGRRKASRHRRGAMPGDGEPPRRRAARAQLVAAGARGGAKIARRAPSRPGRARHQATQCRRAPPKQREAAAGGGRERGCAARPARRRTAAADGAAATARAAAIGGGLATRQGRCAPSAERTRHYC